MTYTRDDRAIDIDSVLDAVARKTNKRGFVITMHDDGKGASISTIGDMAAELDGGNGVDPALSYENCNEESESYRNGARRKGPGNFEPMNIDASRKKDQPANDAARISKLSADARKATADAMLRNRAFAETLKAKSQALWGSKNPHALRPARGA